MRSKSYEKSGVKPIVIPLKFEEESNFARKWNKVNYSEREVKLWLALGLIELHEIVELWLDGVIHFAFEIE